MTLDSIYSQLSSPSFVCISFKGLSSDTIARETRLSTSGEDSKSKSAEKVVAVGKTCQLGTSSVFPQLGIATKQ